MNKYWLDATKEEIERAKITRKAGEDLLQKLKANEKTEFAIANESCFCVTQSEKRIENYIYTECRTCPMRTSCFQFAKIARATQDGKLSIQEQIDALDMILKQFDEDTSGINIEDVKK